MVFADVIFPAFSAPYFAFWFFPGAAFLAMLAEVFVFKLTNFDLGWRRACAGVAGANLLSWFAGVALSLVMPYGLASVPHPMPNGQIHYFLEPGPLFPVFLVFGLVLAYLLSILIEVRFWRRFTRRNPLANSLKTTIWANTASYLVLIAVAAFYIFYFRT